MEERMFVVMARFGDVRSEREQEFQAWFAWSNEQLREIDGLKGRRLLRASDGSYTALVEHQSAETFAAMSTTEVATQVHARLADIVNEPRATTFEVIADLPTSGACCGGTGGHGQHGHERAAVDVSIETHRCCKGA
jgi:heme-degrading monooxygenase HmoA